MELVICEKPSVARSIAAVLNARERQDGFLIGSGYIVSWCIGHLVEMAQTDAYDEKYKKWSVEDLPIIPRQWKHIVPSDKGKQLKVLSALMKRADVDMVICATDAGREGEHIFRLVYEHCRCTKPVKRFWVSSMEERAITEGFQNLKNGEENNPPGAFAGGKSSEKSRNAGYAGKHSPRKEADEGAC